MQTFKGVEKEIILYYCTKKKLIQVDNTFYTFIHFNAFMCPPLLKEFEKKKIFSHHIDI